MSCTLFHQNILPRWYLVVGRNHSLVMGWKTSNYGRGCQTYLDPSFQQTFTCLAALLAQVCKSHG